ncbi:hypothetical protein DPMN_169459 [Dreissena polymorpha]|uniref:THAP-type domain-containing protein n=1 Tax=Dreissena polymorpha TaxID=45954 RepID=A0A9D4IDE3_DREPO|nr:hypothetical protein DPMN_169459 [Dreissena polymorpha]
MCLKRQQKTLWLLPNNRRISRYVIFTRQPFWRHMRTEHFMVQLSSTKELSFDQYRCVENDKMVIKCSIIGCSNSKDHEKDLHYYRIPAIIKNQGEDWEKLTADRRQEWLAKLGQSFENKNIDNVRV